MQVHTTSSSPVLWLWDSVSSMAKGHYFIVVILILGFVRLQLINRTGWVLASGRAQERGSAWSIPGASWCSCGTARAVITHLLCAGRRSRFWGSRRAENSANWGRGGKRCLSAALLGVSTKGRDLGLLRLNYCSPSCSINTRNFSRCPKFLAVLFLELLAKLQCWWDW